MLQAKHKIKFIRTFYFKIFKITAARNDKVLKQRFLAADIFGGLVD